MSTLPRPPFRGGDVLSGRYEVEREINRERACRRGPHAPVSTFAVCIALLLAVAAAADGAGRRDGGLGGATACRGSRALAWWQQGADGSAQWGHAPGDARQRPPGPAAPAAPARPPRHAPAAGGATAVVYAARDRQTGGRVALKVVACGGPKHVPISVVRREASARPPGGRPRPGAAFCSRPAAQLRGCGGAPRGHTRARARTRTRVAPCGFQAPHTLTRHAPATHHARRIYPKPPGHAVVVGGPRAPGAAAGRVRARRGAPRHRGVRGARASPQFASRFLGCGLCVPCRVHVLRGPGLGRDDVRLPDARTRCLLAPASLDAPPPPPPAHLAPSYPPPQWELVEGMDLLELLNASGGRVRPRGWGVGGEGGGGGGGVLQV
jgi:hypothetical protein